MQCYFIMLGLIIPLKIVTKLCSKVSSLKKVKKYLEYLSFVYTLYMENFLKKEFQNLRIN